MARSARLHTPERLAFAWFVVFGIVYLQATGKTPPTFESGTFARSLLEHGTYAWGLSAPWDMGTTTFSAHKAPLLSWLLAVLWSVVPAGAQTLAMAVLNAAAEALALVALLRIVPPTLRTWLGWTFALSPFVLMNVPVISDSAMTHAWLAWGCYFTLTCASQWRRAAIAGACMGLAALSLPASMLFAALAFAWLAINDTERTRDATLIAFALAAVLVVGPWTLRNAVVFHRLIPVASNLPLEIYYGNNPRATGGMYDDACAPANFLDDAHKQALVGLDEATGYARLGREAAGWMAEHPTQALSLRLRAFRYFWHPQAFWLHCPAYAGRWRVLAGINVVYLLVALMGFVSLARTSRRTAWWVAWALVAVTAVYTGTHADIGWRYRAPIEPILCVLVALGARAAFGRIAKR